MGMSFRFRLNLFKVINEIFIKMDSLRKLPEAKYAMDDLMDRTFNAEKKLIDHKQEIIRMTNKIIKNVSMLQVQVTESYTHDRDQMRKKDDALSDLLKLIEMNL